MRRQSVHLSIALFLGLAPASVAHDIPVDAAVQVFVKPAGQRLHLLVRTPLKTMRDVDFRERLGGYLDLEKLAPLLPDTATVWISNFIDIYEGDTRLPKPRVIATCVSLESDRSFRSYEEALAHVTG